MGYFFSWFLIFVASWEDSNFIQNFLHVLIFNSIKMPDNWKISFIKLRQLRCQTWSEVSILNGMYCEIELTNIGFDNTHITHIQLSDERSFVFYVVGNHLPFFYLISFMCLLLTLHPVNLSWVKDPISHIGSLMHFNINHKRCGTFKQVFVSTIFRVLSYFKWHFRA